MAVSAATLIVQSRTNQPIRPNCPIRRVLRAWVADTNAGFAAGRRALINDIRFPA